MNESAYAYALKLLGQRSYTVFRLRRKLHQKEFPDSETSAAIERLAAAGILNDVRYAESFARGRLGANTAFSLRHVTNSLIRRGIDRKTAEQAVEAVADEENFDAKTTIERVVRKKLASMGHLEPDTARRRLYGFLARRGFSPDEISSALKTANLYG